MLRKRKVETRKEQQRRAEKKKKDRSSNQRHTVYQPTTPGNSTRKRPKPGAVVSYYDTSYYHGDVQLHSPQPPKSSAFHTTAEDILSFSSGGRGSSSDDDDASPYTDDPSYGLEDDYDENNTFESDDEYYDYYGSDHQRGKRRQDDDQFTTNRHHPQPQTGRQYRTTTTTTTKPKLSTAPANRLNPSLLRVSPQPPPPRTTTAATPRRFGGEGRGGGRRSPYYSTNSRTTKASSPRSTSKSRFLQRWTLDTYCCGAGGGGVCSAPPPPGISLAEEHRLWQDTLQHEREKSRRAQRSSPSPPTATIQQVEVVPVDPNFGPRHGEFAYTEMDGVGMVFAPAQLPTTPPARQPWWEREEWNEFEATTATAVESVANTTHILRNTKGKSSCFATTTTTTCCPQQPSLLHQAQIPARPRLVKDVHSIFRRQPQPQQPHQQQQQQQQQQQHHQRRHQYGNTASASTTARHRTHHHQRQQQHQQQQQQQPRTDMVVHQQQSNATGASHATRSSYNSDLDASLEKRQRRHSRLDGNLLQQEDKHRQRFPIRQERKESSRKEVYRIPPEKEDTRTSQQQRHQVLEDDLDRLRFLREKERVQHHERISYGGKERERESEQQRSQRVERFHPRSDSEMSATERSVDLSLPHLNHDYGRSMLELRTDYGNPIIVEHVHKKPSSNTTSGSDLSLVVKKKYGTAGRLLDESTDASADYSASQSSESILRKLPTKRPLASSTPTRQPPASSGEAEINRDMARRIERQRPSTTVASNMDRSMTFKLEPLTKSPSKEASTTVENPIRLDDVSVRSKQSLRRSNSASPIRLVDDSPRSFLFVDLCGDENKDSTTVPPPRFIRTSPHGRQPLTPTANPEPSPNVRAASPSLRSRLSPYRRPLSPIRLYGDPPVPRREDGSPVASPKKARQQVTPLNGQETGRSSLGISPSKLKDLLACLSPRGTGLTGLGGGGEEDAAGGMILFQPTINIYPGRDENHLNRDDDVDEEESKQTAPNEDDNPHVEENTKLTRDQVMARKLQQTHSPIKGRSSAIVKNVRISPRREKEWGVGRKKEAMHQTGNNIPRPGASPSKAIVVVQDDEYIDAGGIVDNNERVLDLQYSTIWMRRQQERRQRRSPRSFTKPKRGPTRISSPQQISCDLEEQGPPMSAPSGVHEQVQVIDLSSIDQVWDGDNPNSTMEASVDFSSNVISVPTSLMIEKITHCSPEDHTLHNGNPMSGETTTQEHVPDGQGVQSQKETETEFCVAERDESSLTATNVFANNNKAEVRSIGDDSSSKSDGRREVPVIDKELSWSALMKLKKLYYISPTDETDSVLLSRNNTVPIPKSAYSKEPDFPKLQNSESGLDEDYESYGVSTDETKSTYGKHVDAPWAKPKLSSRLAMRSVPMSPDGPRSLFDTIQSGMESSHVYVPSSLDSPPSNNSSSTDLQSVSSTSVLGNIFVDPADQSLYSLLLKSERKKGRSLVSQSDQNLLTEDKSCSSEESTVSLDHVVSTELVEKEPPMRRTLQESEPNKSSERKIHTELVKRGKNSVARPYRSPKEKQTTDMLQSINEQSGDDLEKKYLTLSPHYGHWQDRVQHNEPPVLSHHDEPSLESTRSYQGSTKTRLDRLRRLQARLHTQNRVKPIPNPNPKNPVVVVADRSHGSGTIAERLNGARQRASKSLRRSVVSSLVQLSSPNTSPRLPAEKSPRKQRPPPIHGLVEVYLQEKKDEQGKEKRQTTMSTPCQQESKSYSSSSTRRNKELVNALPLVAKARNAASAKPGSLLWRATAGQER